MKMETVSDLAPRDVVAEALASLSADDLTLRSLSEHHVHLAGAKRRPTLWLRAVLVGVLASHATLVLWLMVDSRAYVGDRHLGELTVLYGLVAWPAALVAFALHMLATRGEAGVAVAATALPGGGSRVLAQAYGSALAEERAEAFLERVARAGERAKPMALADRMVRR